MLSPSESDETRGRHTIDPTEPEFVLSELCASLRLAYLPPGETTALCLDRICTVRTADHVVDVSSKAFYEPMNDEPALIAKWFSAEAACRPA